MITISFEVEGYVSSRSRPESGEGYVGGLGESYRVPDVSCEKHSNTSHVKQLPQGTGVSTICDV